MTFSSRSNINGKGRCCIYGIFYSGELGYYFTYWKLDQKRPRINLFNNSKGEVLLNGNIQQILGAFSTTFYHLTMQNGTKIMNVNTGVGGTSSPYNVLNPITIFSLKSNMLSVYNPVPGGIRPAQGLF
ncbi:MAG: hypothetical protein IPJ26_17330 [Bacteroidetes bacterium]|nr:hypothetical protein [Bacteroidota bacterium]